jgi:hypothetical protein
MWIEPPNTASGPMPAELATAVDLWRRRNPGYGHRLWERDDVLRLCAEHGRADVAACIGQCRFPAMQADIARLFVLSRFGGFWSDLKLRPRQPISPALRGFATVLVEHFPKPELPDPRGVLVNGFIGAIPGAPVIASALNLALANVRERQGDGVFAITGPGVLTTAWRSHRLAHPEQAASVRVIAHADAWGVLWDVLPDTYNPPAAHWAERQQRESPFVEEGSSHGLEPGASGLFVAVPGHLSRIDRVHSKQGFHPFESGPSFSWVSDESTPRIFFDALLPFDRLRLKMFVKAGVALSEAAFLLNGKPVPWEAHSEGEGWCLVDLGPFTVGASWNQLAVCPPRGVTADSSDPRVLSVAVAWLQPWIENPIRRA